MQKEQIRYSVVLRDRQMGQKSGVHEHRGRVENLRVKQNAKATNTMDLPPVSLLLRSVDLFDSSLLPRYVGNSSS